MWECGMYEVYVSVEVAFNYVVEQNNTCKHNSRPQQSYFSI